VYAAIRQGKAKTGMAEELTRRIKDGAIPIISDVPGFMAYYVVYAPDDTVTAISIRLRRSRRVKQACARVDRAESCAPAYRGSHGVGRAGDRAHLGVATNSCVWDASLLATMSALPPKADMCGATRYVRFGPEAHINRTTPPMSEQSKQGINL